MATKKVLARGQFTIIDYNDAASLSAGITCNKSLTVVVNDSGNKSEEVAWSSKHPLIVTPVVYQSSFSSGMNNLATELLDLQWAYRTQGNDWRSVDGDNRFEVVTDAKQLDGYDAIKNSLVVICDEDESKTPLLTRTSQVVDFRFTGTFRDSSDMNTHVEGLITFTCVVNGRSNVIVTLTTPEGDIFVNQEQNEKTILAELWRGGEVDYTDIEYRWYKQLASVFTPKKAVNVLTQDNRVKFTFDVKDPNIQIGSLAYFSKNTTDSVDKFKNLTGYTDNDLLQSQGKIVQGEVVEVAGYTATMVLNVSLSGLTGLNSGVVVIPRWYDAVAGPGWARIITDRTGVDTSLADAKEFDHAAYYTREIPTNKVEESGNNIVGGNVLHITPDSVSGTENFRCIIRDLDETTNEGKTDIKSMVITVRDFSDPYKVDISSPQGNIIKNGQGYILVTAEVRQGDTILTDDKIRNILFSWTLRDADGNLVGQTTGDNGEVVITGNMFTCNDGNDNGHGIEGYGMEQYEVPAKYLGVQGDGKMSIPYTQVVITPDDVRKKATVFCELKV